MAEIDELAARIRQLETQLGTFNVGAIADRVANFSSGSCTNGCTGNCTGGCTKGCTGNCLAQPAGEFEVFDKVLRGMAG